MDIPQIVAGRFRIERVIGRGGMGTVYRASQLGLERTVAIKVLKQEFAADPAVAERFMREARTMAKLKHPRAAMIFDAGRLADGRPFLVMEYVEGVTLSETLEREGRLTPARAVRIASEICDVLADAHGLGIVHRDLKPSNIMLNERGVCVLDFGIAKVLANSTEVTRTHATTESGLIIGTPRYMSPEQCVGQLVGPASDLYSVGVLVYEMLAGHPPFVDQLSSAVLIKQATAPPPPLVALRPDVPRPLALAAHTLLAKNPASRPKTAAAARTMLERSIATAASAPSARSQSETTPFAATIAALDASGSAAMRAATILVVTVMLGALLFALASNRRPPADGYDAASQATALPLAQHARSPTARVEPTPSRVIAANDSAVRNAPAPVVARPVSEGEALRIAASVAGSGVADALVLRTREGPAIAAIREDPSDGTTTLLILERRGGERFRVATRAALDVEKFRRADWTTEVLDIDSDGYDEVLCTGEHERRRRGRRIVLYAPHARQTYTLQVTPERRRPDTLNAVWSRNVATEAARPFRSTLRQRAYARANSF